MPRRKPTEPRPVGRPRRSASSASTEFVGLKITPDERVAWETAAQADAVSLSRYVIDAVNRRIARTK